MFTANRIGTPVFVNATNKSASNPAALNTQALNASADFVANMFNPTPLSGPFQTTRFGGTTTVNIARGLQFGIVCAVTATPPAQDINAVGVEVDMNLVGHLPGNVEAVPVIGFTGQVGAPWGNVSFQRGFRQLGPSSVQAATAVVGRCFHLKESIVFETLSGSSGGIGGGFGIGWLFFDHGTGAAVNVGGWHGNLAVRSLDRNLNYYNPRS